MGNIARGTTNITAIRRGQAAVSKVYRGQSLIWQPGGGGGGWVTDSLYSYYDPFDSVLSGATLTDISGNGRTATLVGTWSIDSEGFVFTTRGSSAPYATFSSPNFDGAAFTFEVWFKVATGSTYDSEPNIISYYEGNRQQAIGFKAGGESNISFAQLQNQAGSTAEMKYTSGGSVINGNWYQYVMTVPASGTARYYRNAVEVVTATNPGGDLYGTVTTLSYGGTVGPGTFRRGFSNARGGLVRIYTKELSSTEVTQNFNANKADYGL